MSQPVDQLDPRTPVAVGVGQSSERLGEPGYRRRSPVDLAADAAREALGIAVEAGSVVQTAEACQVPVTVQQTR